jgi:hypothetical protein
MVHGAKAAALFVGESRCLATQARSIVQVVMLAKIDCETVRQIGNEPLQLGAIGGLSPKSHLSLSEPRTISVSYVEPELRRDRPCLGRPRRAGGHFRMVGGDSRAKCGRDLPSRIRISAMNLRLRPSLTSEWIASGHTFWRARVRFLLWSCILSVACCWRCATRGRRLSRRGSIWS